MLTPRNKAEEADGHFLGSSWFPATIPAPALAPLAPDYCPTPPHQGEGCHCQEECKLREDRAGSDLVLPLNMRGQPVLLLTKAMDEETPRTLTGTPRPTQQAPWITSGTCSGSSGFSTASLWGKRTTASRWENTRFTGIESALT